MTLFDVVASLVAAAVVYFSFFFRYPRHGRARLPKPATLPKNEPDAHGG